MNIQMIDYNTMNSTEMYHDEYWLYAGVNWVI